MDTALIKKLIQKKRIQLFEDIFQYETVESVAIAMGCGIDQVEAIRRDCSVMRLGQLFALSEALGLPWRKLADLFTS
jgi:ribonuclease HII